MHDSSLQFLVFLYVLRVILQFYVPVLWYQGQMDSVFLTKGLVLTVYVYVRRYFASMIASFSDLLYSYCYKSGALLLCLLPIINLKLKYNWTSCRCLIQTPRHRGASTRIFAKLVATVSQSYMSSYILHVLYQMYSYNECVYSLVGLFAYMID